MITLVKVNVLTDDPGLPEWLRDKIEKVLQDAIRDDPEPQHANVQLEWKDTVNTTAYMTGLTGKSPERIRLPLGQSSTGASRRSVPSAKRKASRSGATVGNS